MRALIQPRFLPVLLAAGLTSLAPTLLRPATAAPAAAQKSAGKKPSHVVLPPNAPPAITIAAGQPAYAAPMRSLSSFIIALQTGHRERAVRLLSSRVTAPERQAFLARQWPRANAEAEGNFGQVLFEKDLQIRARDKIRGDLLRCSVGPRNIAHLPRMRTKGKGLIGYIEVPMRREHGDWLVDLHPGKGL